MPEEILPPPTPPDFSDSQIEENEIAELEASETFVDDYNEKTGFTIKEKIYAGIIGFFAFLFFIILIFPYEELARVILSKVSSENQIIIDFKNLELPFFGSKTIDGFLFQGKDNTEVTAETIDLDTSYSSLLDKSFKGDIEITSFKLDLIDIGLTFKNISILDSDLEGLDKSTGLMNFHIKINAVNGVLKRSPSITFVDINLKDLNLKNFVLDAKKEKSGLKVKIEKFLLTTNIATIKAKGNIELSEVLKASRLDLEICPTFNEKFAADREDIVNNLKFLMANKPCFTLEGTFSQPKPNLPGIKELQGGMGSTPNIPTPTMPAVAPPPP